MTTILTANVEFTPPPPLMAATFQTYGFTQPVVDKVIDSQGAYGFIARVEGERKFAELLSPIGPEAAVARLAREIVRNRQ